MDAINAKIGNRYITIDFDDVFYFVSDGVYTRVVHQTGEVLILDSLNSLEDKYGDKCLRIQRGVLVNMMYLESINEEEYKCTAKLRGINETLPVSKRQIANIRDKLSGVDSVDMVIDERHKWIVDYVKKQGSVDILNEEFVYRYIKKFSPSFEPKYAAPKCPQLNKDLNTLYKERRLDRVSVGTPSELILREYPKWVYRYFNKTSRAK